MSAKHLPLLLTVDGSAPPIDTVYFNFSKRVQQFLELESAHIEGNSFPPYKDKAIHYEPPPHLMYIYTNICEYSYLGDTRAQILRVVRIPYDSKTGDINTTLIFNPIHYVCVREIDLDVIHIKMCDVEGNLFPFGRGNLIAKLHFKPVSF